MRVVIDIETNRLINPDKIWVIVCKDIDSGKYWIFREGDWDAFLEMAKDVSCFVGHNILGFDWPILDRLLGMGSGSWSPGVGICDTLVLSKLVNYSRPGGHSIEQYGIEYGYEKFKHYDFTQYSEELEQYCVRDVDICHKVFLQHEDFYKRRENLPSILLEHSFQNITNELSNNGFYFSIAKAKKLLTYVTEELSILDNNIALSFKPKLKLIRVITPEVTKYNTISLSTIPRDMRKDIHWLTAGAPFSYCRWVEFNPNSHRQIVEVLNQAGWKPEDKTTAHKEAERTKHNEALKILKVTGWKVNETNLETLPPSAPSGARLLAKRILLESRRRTLTEWLGLVQEDNRIHGKFYAIGAWTHRMAHQQPNTANIPNELDTQGKRKLLGKELRSLWSAPKGRLLVGVDAESIQLRIFAHYIDDPEFTEALVNGKKEQRTDPHCLNQSILGAKTRDAAKRYIYALLLGAGKGKLREILDCSGEVAEAAYERLLRRYTGYAALKQTIIPRDAKRGWFIGLDGRRVRIPGDTEGQRRHLCMSGYLQNGEAVVMKLATTKWFDWLKTVDAKLVNFVHDEWQTECPNMEIALCIAKRQAQSLYDTGLELGLKCPLSGSYGTNLETYTVGTNWAQTH